MAVAPGTRLGPYDITAQLGEGGMGEVWCARDTKLDRDVAIKILPEAFAHDAERLARFQREAKTLASLNHPNIATIYGLEESGGMTALVMELVEGEDLSQRITRGPIPVEEALPIATQIAEALEAAHEKGIIHRDLKPANIKLRPDGTVKVLDFGLAKALEPVGAPAAHVSQLPTITTPAMTQAGVILGTAAYMSPEQARGKPVDKRADIWAFGCVLYEMLTGQRAFGGEDVADTLGSVMKVEPGWAALSGAIAPRVRQVVRACLQKNPKQRIDSAQAVRLALEGAFETTIERSAVAPPALGWRMALPWVAGIVIGATVAGGFALSLWPTGPRAAAGVTSLTVPLHSGTDTGAGIGGIAAISDDGTHLAYAAGGGLYLRPMSAREAVLVQGADGAAAPFFSPDGQWVGFFQGGALKRVSILGGTPETMAAAPGGAAVGASWAPDDWVYYAPTNNSGLWRVPAFGGDPEQVTTLDRAAGDISHRWPQVLPGDEAVLFTNMRGPGWDEKDVELHVLATGTRRVVMSGGQTGRYVRSGHLVYVRADALMAVRFDDATWEVNGTGVPLGMDQLASGEGGFVTVSSTGTLAYVWGGIGTDRQLVWRDRLGGSEAVPGPRRPYQSVSIDPDGQRAAVWLDGPMATVGIVDLERGTLRPLQSAASGQFPVWIPPGDRVAYRRTHDGRRDLYVRAADGGGSEEPLTTAEYTQTAYDVSTDGGWLAFAEIHPETGTDVWMLPLVGGGSPQVFAHTASVESRPAFSPNGRWVAFESNPSGQREIWARPFSGPGPSVQLSTTGGIQPRWSPDGGELYYVAQDGWLTAVPVAIGATLRPGRPERLFRLQGSQWFDVAPDGRFLTIESAGASAADARIEIVLNFDEELRRLMPTN